MMLLQVAVAWSATTPPPSAVDLGLSQYAINPDYDGKDRDTAPDAGAYER